MSETWHRMTALDLGAAIEAGRIDPVTLTERFLDRVEALDRERTIYLRTTPERARAEASAARDRARAGLRRGPLDGVPISWKDLFDTARIPTTAAAPLLSNRVPQTDATVVARATRAGLVCLGKTNLTEFAFSGLGINPAHGTPPNPFDGDVDRVPGGSSSGAAVSVARGLAAAGVGSDTGGSVRVPAAWNGLVGLKTTAGSLPMDGVIPLAPSLDTIGTLTRDVADANALFAVLAARRPADLAGASLKGLRLSVARTLVWDEAEEGVESAVRTAIERLAAAGAKVVWEDVPVFEELTQVLEKLGNPLNIEAFATWRTTIEAHSDRIYHNVLSRFMNGANAGAAEFEEVRREVARLKRAFRTQLMRCAALLAPTVRIAPPPIADLTADDGAYHRANLMSVHNTRLINLLEGCALTLPCGEDGRGLPVGLMLVAPGGAEGALLRLARAVEAALADVAGTSPA
ncbi:MAG: amidase [Alphaproteobacteria bacterium]